MPLTEADREAAKKRKLESLASVLSSSGSQSTPQQGQNANAGTQQTIVQAGPSASGSGKAVAPPAANAPATAANIMAVEPTFLLDLDQFAQVLNMKNDTLKALAKAMDTDVDGDVKAMMILKIVRYMGTCKSVKAFNPDTNTFEFESLEKQDFQQPAVPPS